ncbi:GNAT family N-acetyltransferase [Nocardioides sp. NPDC057772]|uniref:GNAT family N-acetyltransferase n=1 Tax=Nocardioides sp. NPDC057772 TaxID=3346245 RepID=UPI00366D49BB
MIIVERAEPGDPATRALLQEWKPGKKASTTGRFLYLIARIGTEPAGVLEGHHDYGSWSDLKDYCHLGENDLGSYISSLYVRPAHRRQGVADALLDWFIEDARQERSVAVVAHPDEEGRGRGARIALNQKHGLEFARPLEAWDEPWLMVLPLS